MRLLVLGLEHALRSASVHRQPGSNAKRVHLALFLSPLWRSRPLVDEVRIVIQRPAVHSRALQASHSPAASDGCSRCASAGSRASTLACTARRCEVRRIENARPCCRVRTRHFAGHALRQARPRLGRRFGTFTRAEPWRSGSGQPESMARSCEVRRIENARHCCRVRTRYLSGHALRQARPRLGRRSGTFTRAGPRRPGTAQPKSMARRCEVRRIENSRLAFDRELGRFHQRARDAHATRQTADRREPASPRASAARAPRSRPPRAPSPRGAARARSRRTRSAGRGSWPG
jgi:hypothetical protein